MLSPAVQNSLYPRFVLHYFKSLPLKYFKCLFFTNVIGIPSTINKWIKKKSTINNSKWRIFFSVCVYAQISVLSLFHKETLSQLLKWNDLLAENYTGT